MKSVRLTLYNEIMGHRVPLLLINSSVVLHVKDWSSEVCKYFTQASAYMPYELFLHHRGETIDA